MRFYTSDTHFTHANILRYCDRPFNSVAHMNAEMVARWNSIVSPSDQVFHLGDVGMGMKPETEEALALLNGWKFLMPGNHDEVSSVVKEARREKFRPVYERYFKIWPETAEIKIGDWQVRMSHYPHHGDSKDHDRHLDLRPPDDGMPLLHGHVHTKDKAHDDNMFHVGVDAHDFTPVPESEILEWLESL